MRGGKRLAVFFLLLLGWFVLIDAIIDRGVKKISTSHYGTLNKSAQGAINSQIIISGSSRALAHYDTAVIRSLTGVSAYNLGLDGSHSDIQLALLRLYLKHNKNPEIVIHNLDMHSFESSEILYNAPSLLPYLQDRELFSSIRRIEPAAWKWWALPLYGYATEDFRFTWLIGLGALFGFQPREDTIYGFRPSDETWNTDFARFKARHPDGVSHRIEASGIKALEDLIQLCRTKRIKLIFVYSPQYYEMLDLVRNREEIFDKLRELAAVNDVPLWDFTTSPICRDRYYFYNSQHLNRKGALLFSTELTERLVREIPFSKTQRSTHGSISRD